MKRLLILSICLILLSGCAATSMVAPDRKPDLAPRTDMATLVIIRDTSFGFAIVFWNYLDGKLIGETKGKTYFVTRVKPGPHYVVVATENAAVAHLNFEPGKIYSTSSRCRTRVMELNRCVTFLQLRKSRST